MNATPIQPGPDERAELFRMLPGPVERDLPSGRHQRLQEFVMSQIHQDLRQAGQAPLRSSKRRPLVLASALTAIAATAAATAAVVIAADGHESPGSRPATPAVTEFSGRQILLAAADTAERTPVGSGTYWYVKTVTRDSETDPPLTSERWTRRDGQMWYRGGKTAGKVLKSPFSAPLRLGGPDVSFDQIQKLPVTPDALQAWIADALKHSDVRTSAGRPDAAMRAQFVFDGLVSLVSELPAPSKVRAAAFRAIATYSNVKSLGAVAGGQGLEITPPEAPPTSSGPGNAKDGAEFERDQAMKAKGSAAERDAVRLVVDPVSSRVRETNFYVTADGAEAFVPGGATIVAKWTNELPR